MLAMAERKLVDVRSRAEDLEMQVAELQRQLKETEGGAGANKAEEDASGITEQLTIAEPRYGLTDSE